MKRFPWQRHLVLMWLFVFVVYLPFFVFMVIRHNVGRISMSAIGWTTGGIHYLVVYIALTLPFCLYMLFFFDKYFAGNNRFTRVMAIISCALITIGTFIPLHRYGPMLDFAHTSLSVSGAAMLMLTILSALVRYALRERRKTAVLLLCGIYAAALAAGFSVLGTAALFQLSAGMSFFIVLLFANTFLLLSSANSNNRRSDGAIG